MERRKDTVKKMGKKKKTVILTDEILGTNTTLDKSLGC